MKWNKITIIVPSDMYFELLLHADWTASHLVPTAQRLYLSQLKYPVPVTAPLNLNI